MMKFDDEPTVDYKTEEWLANAIPPTPIPGGSIEGALKDVNGAFPLNRLVDQNGKIDDKKLEVFRRLLENLRLDNPGIADAIAEWIDSNDEHDKPGGAESLACVER